MNTSTTTTRQQSIDRDAAHALAGVIPNALAEIIRESDPADGPYTLEVARSPRGPWVASLVATMSTSRGRQAVPLFDPITGDECLAAEGPSMAGALAALGAKLEAYYPPTLPGEYMAAEGDRVTVTDKASACFGRVGIVGTVGHFTDSTLCAVRFVNADGSAGTVPLRFDQLAAAPAEEPAYIAPDTQAETDHETVAEAVEAAINAGAAVVQQALGVKTGDFAGIHFADPDARLVEHLTRAFREYLDAERQEARRELGHGYEELAQVPPTGVVGNGPGDTAF